MTLPISKFFNYQHENEKLAIHYLEWGSEHQNVLVCAHGLTRNAHDFDYLSRVVSKHYRVIALDYPGRGESQWLDNKDEYVIPTYVGLSVAMLDQLNIESVAWLGTSMGGLIGMIVASSFPNRINRLIINDVGPQVPNIAIDRIRDYLILKQHFKNLTDFESHLRLIYQPFGALSEQQWQHLVKYSHYTDDQGDIQFNYDPDISKPFKENTADEAGLWHFWEQINCPVFLLHGENSDILTPTIIDTMKQHQPQLTLKTIQNVGHAPALMDALQINLIKDWLD